MDALFSKNTAGSPTIWWLLFSEENPVHFVMFFWGSSSSFSQNLWTSDRQCNFESFQMSTFFNMTRILSDFQLKIHGRVFSCLGNKRFQPTKPTWWCDVGSLRVSPTAGREAEHIPEGRRIPLLIAAMGCWEFLNRGNHRWCNGVMMIFSRFFMGVRSGVIWTDGSWGFNWNDVASTLVGSKSNLSNLYTLKQFGTWTLIVFDWFNHEEEVVWVMNIKDRQMSCCQWDFFLGCEMDLSSWIGL